jgi:hypothetical protein
MSGTCENEAIIPLSKVCVVSPRTNDHHPSPTIQAMLWPQHQSHIHCTWETGTPHQIERYICVIIVFIRSYKPNLPKEDLDMSIDKKDQEAARRALEEWRKSAKRPQKFMAEHTVKEDETLSHIALKYYGSAVKEKWMVIYEANKDVIGDNPNVIVPGQMLKIPEL